MLAYYGLGALAQHRVNLLIVDGTNSVQSFLSWGASAQSSGLD